MQIKAAVHRLAFQPLSIERLELSEPQAEEVLVRVVASGICHTDLMVRDGHVPLPKLPCVLGHEGAGIVLAVGDAVNRVEVGDHVLLSFASCGECDRCLSQEPAYCRNFFMENFSGRRRDGTCTLHNHEEEVHGSFFGQSSFASHSLVHQRNLVKVAKDVPLELLGPLGCGLQTGAGAVLNFLKPSAGSSLVVYGVGAVGIAAVMAAQISGCKTIIAVDVHDNRLALAFELGATHVINAREHSPVEKIKELVVGGADYVVEASGMPPVMVNALQSVRQAGSVALLGVAPAGSKVELDMNLLGGGRIIKSCIEGDSVPDTFIPELIEFYRKGQFPLEKLIKFYELEDINQAIEDSEKGEILKAVVRMA